MRNNITIKYGDYILDYDDETAIALDYNSFNFSDISKIWLNRTNTFTLPITVNNQSAFEFCESSNSNPSSVYSNTDCSIYKDGVLILSGTLYVESISEERYTCNFTENKNAFDLLNSLPYSKVQGDEYPVSLCSLIVKYWNTKFLPKVINLYITLKHKQPETAAEYMEAIILYTNRLKLDGINPETEFVMPLVDNTFYKRVGQYKTVDGIKGEYKVEVYDNKTDISPSAASTKKANGFIVSKFFASGGKLVYDSNKMGWFLGKDYPESITNNFRYGMTLISPIWVRLDVVLKVMSEYCGFEITGIYEEMKKHLGNREQYLFLSGVEFAFDFNAGFRGSSIQDGEVEFIFDGKLQMIKGGVNKYGYQFNEGISDIPLDMFGNKTALDILKVLAQEYALTPLINNVDKTISFSNISDVTTSEPIRLVLIDTNQKRNRIYPTLAIEKRFAIDNLARNNYIRYSSIADNDTYAGALNIVSTNDHVTESADICTIDRHLFGYNTYYQKIDGEDVIVEDQVIPVNLSDDSDMFKEIIFGIPSAGWNEWEQSSKTDDNLIPHGSLLPQVVCISLSLYTDSQLTTPQKALMNGCMNISLEELSVSKINHMYNGLCVGEIKSYKTMQDMLYRPVYLKISVAYDEVFLHNWRALNVVEVEGLTGKYFVQSVSKYNPRTDDTLELELIKIPYVI